MCTLPNISYNELSLKEKNDNVDMLNEKLITLFSREFRICYNFDSIVYDTQNY